MCFSAPASFLAAGGLSAIGVASFRRARKRERILVGATFLFAFQQALEGIQWLVSFTGVLSAIAAYGFLIVALLVWPVYVPWVIYRLDSKRRKFMRWCLAIGSGVTAYFAWYLIMHPIVVEKVSHGISYGLGPTPWVIVIGYVIATIGALLASSIGIFRTMGFFVLVAAIVAWVFFSAAFASVWCFFAALLSGVLYLYLARK